MFNASNRYQNNYKLSVHFIYPLYKKKNNGAKELYCAVEF